MDIRSKFTLIVPERVIKAFDITEDTIFLVEYKDGELSVEPINDYDEEDYTDYINDSSEEDELYGDSYNDGFCDGYAEGYRSGFNDALSGREYKETQPSDCGIDCDYDCSECRYKDRNKRRFN